MSDDPYAWTVLPHRPIEEVEKNLWLVSGDVPRMPLKRTMAVARGADGRLTIHSAIALEPTAMAQLEAWGEPAFLLVPNGWHRLDAARYRARYPGLTVLCPPGSRRTVEKAVAVDGLYADFPTDPEVSLEVLDGVKGREGVLRVNHDDRATLVFCDLLFNLPKGRGLGGMIYNLMGSTGGPKVTRIAKLGMVADRAALRAHLERLAGIPGLARLVPGHGRVLDRDAAAVLRNVAAAL